MLKKIVFIPDTHAPYENKEAFDLLLKARRIFAPDYTVILGDFADAESVSAHSKGAGRLANLEGEIAAVNARLDQLDEHKDTRIYIEGNHEVRLKTYINDKAPELFGLVTIPKLLRLKDRGWKYVDYREFHKIGKMSISHDLGTAGPTAHMKAQSLMGGNVTIGHTHSLGLYYSGNAKGETHVGANFGWLGDASKIKYMSRALVARWSLGFGVGHMEANGTVHLQTVPIIDGRCVVEGKLITL